MIFSEYFAIIRFLQLLVPPSPSLGTDSKVNFY